MPFADPGPGGSERCPADEPSHVNESAALRNYTESYVYDKVGNILSMRYQAGTVNWTRRYELAATSNRLLSTGLPDDGPTATPYSATYAYDEHGSMTSMPHLPTMGWDYNDQMWQVDLGGGGTAYYTYDAAGQRVRKVWEHSGLVEERIYLGGWEVYRKRDPLGNLLLERETLHGMDGARRVVLVETKTVDVDAVGVFTPVSRMRFQLDNHLGSASLEVDESGLVIGYEEYHPYGTTAYASGRSAVEVSGKRYRYTGKERDEETGLYYHGVRHLAPWLGRWTSADPAGMVDGPNLYAYVEGNPIRLLDPTGEFGVALLYQARELASRASQAIDRAYKAAPDAVSDAASAAATAAAKYVLVPLVEGFTGGSSVSAPETEKEARDAPKAQTYTEQVVVVAASVAGGKLGGAVAGRVVAGLGSATARGVLVAAGSGSTAAVAGLAAHDVSTGTTSKPGDYLAAAGLGAVGGVAIHGAGRAAGAGIKGAKAVARRVAPVLKEAALAPAGLALGMGVGAPLKLPKLAQVEHVASPLDEMVAMSKPSTKARLIQKQAYVNPGHHDPSSPNYNSTKSVLPPNHVELFEQSTSVAGDNGKVTRWTKEGTGKTAVYHRFQEHGPGEFHWNGSTKGATKGGQPRVIKANHVPRSVQ
jgi:RHS repeat-associated protein